jgi:hypothetical protein
LQRSSLLGNTSKVDEETASCLQDCLAYYAAAQAAWGDPQGFLNAFSRVAMSGLKPALIGL